MGETEKLKGRQAPGGPRPAEAITSTGNERVKRAVALRDKRERDRTGLMLIEGVRELERAIVAGVALERVYFCPAIIAHDEERELLASLVASRTRTVEVSARVFEKLTYRGSTGGFLAVAQQPALKLADLPAKIDALFLVVDAVEKPGNLGAIVRSADGAGAGGVIVCDSHTDLYNPNVIRASIGTVFNVPCAQAETEESIRWLKDTGTKIVTAAPEAELLYTRIDFTGRRAIVVGAEDVGLPDAWLEASDWKVRIPMKGAADSLNVSATAAILLYEALRQRGEP
ncbi:MAG: RNA methyltransferase [Candidatus Krumholzibacteria bacterium]|nr:RNA methyltransferase [Candidatus Krumholzibacteria bacterium]